MIRRVKSEAMLKGLDPSDWAAEVFEQALDKADIRKSITGEKHA